MADGAKFSTGGQGAPDMDFAYQASTGGGWADWGPFSIDSRGFNRDWVENHNVTDVRLLWARHGTQKPRQAPDAYRFNALFFDGHVATLGDLEGSNPSLWAPKGTVIPIGEMYEDVKARYGITSDFTVGD